MVTLKRLIMISPSPFNTAGALSNNQDVCNTLTNVNVMLVTANVGTLFEDPERLMKTWLREFLRKVTEVQPQFLALHFQEVGGKTYEKSMQHVREFVGYLCDAPEMKEFTCNRIYMDEDFNSAEHFTALGNLYFVHATLSNVQLWNFHTHSWESAQDKHTYFGNLEKIATKEKSKFPKNFFPECKWSRKGFMRTRWNLNQTVFDCLNIHLFHDASNLSACEEFPSIYCKTRRRALLHTLERLHLDEKNGFAAYFIFGDFNFRCDTEGVIKELTKDLTVHRIQNLKNDNTKVYYRNSDGDDVLSIGKKEFNYADHQIKFKQIWLKNFDKELDELSDILYEFPIGFAPSYPYEENPTMPTDFMSTRCPSWCDRILLSQHARIICNEHEPVHYNIIGENVCMGDHKPIYLNFRLKSNQGWTESTQLAQDCLKRIENARGNLIRMQCQLDNEGETVALPIKWRYIYFKEIQQKETIDPAEHNVDQIASTQVESVKTSESPYTIILKETNI